MPEPSRVTRLAILLPALLCLSSCRSRSALAEPDVVIVALPQLDQPVVQRKNMLWIPPGTFISGTPADTLPRLADVEPPGVAVTLHGFHIDQFPFPNEPGAIQTTGLSQAEARSQCEELSKRLCTELEWERACKGPLNSVYEYGNTWRPDECGSGSSLKLPTGSRVGCRSAFDVHDLHGGAAEWTASDWARGDPRPLVVVRGGSGNPADVTGRCAHATHARADAKRSDLGFRCCAGEPNDAVVQLEVTRAPVPLVPLKFDRELAGALQAVLPHDRLRKAAADFHVDRLWHWFPIGNEQLIVAAGCARAGPSASCGIIVARPATPSPRFLAFASSSGWVPLLKIDDDRRLIWLYGVDDRGQFRRRIEYVWGRVGVGDEDRASEPRKKKKRD